MFKCDVCGREVPVEEVQDDYGDGHCICVGCWVPTPEEEEEVTDE